MVDEPNKTPGFIKNLILTDQLNRLIIIVVAAVSLSIFVILGFLSLLGVLQGIGSPADFFILAIL